MIALAFLFIIIIGLLVVVIRLLQKFFDTYVNMCGTQYPTAEVLATNIKTNPFNQELNHLAVSREAALEECFISLENSKMMPPQKTEVLFQSLKIYLQSILKLLKTE